MIGLIKNMAFYIILSTLVLLSVIACKPVIPSGEVITKNYEITDFTGVDIGSTFKAQITMADSYSVKVTFNKNLENHIKVSKDGEKLVINMKGVMITGRATLEAEITMPSIASVNFSGASHGTLKEFNLNNDFTSNISGASTLEFMDVNITGAFNNTVSGASRNTGSISANSMDLIVSSASTMEFTGTVNDMKLEVSGASSAKFSSLSVKNVNALVSGASNATIKVSEKLDVSVSGASRLEYIGSSNLVIGEVNITGASTFKKVS